MPQVVHGGLACMVSLNDLADRRPARWTIDGDEVLDIGGHRMRFLPTPHVPHNWESGLWFDETTETLFAGDLFTHVGDGPAVTSDDIVEPALAGEEIFHATSLGPNVAPTLRRLAALEPDDARDDARVVVSGQRCTTARGAGSRLRDLRRRPGRVTAG